MANAQSLFEILKTTIYLSDFAAVITNGKICEWNKDEMREDIEDQATQFLYRQDYHQWEIDDIKFCGSATEHLDEMYPEILREIENDTIEEYAFGILWNVGIEKKDLKSIEFKV